MATQPSGPRASGTVIDEACLASWLRCPITHKPLRLKDGAWAADSEKERYAVTASGIPRFAEKFCSEEGRIQQSHYDKVVSAYLENLTYPHTQEYMNYLDGVLFDAIGEVPLGDVAEICCGRGEALRLLREDLTRGLGVDVSLNMLESGRKELADASIAFAQGDATMLPLREGQFDHVFMLGGIHHVNDRKKLFAEAFRILKPGGRFIFREPVSDLWLWRALRWVVYRLSPALDATTERPLRWKETVPYLLDAGFELVSWRTCGFLGFCFLMNSDVLIVNRLFRYLPGIRLFTRGMAGMDELCVRTPGLRRAGLQVVGVARKPEDHSG